MHKFLSLFMLFVIAIIPLAFAEVVIIKPSEVAMAGTYNSTYDAKAGTGDCPSGQVVMNTTSSGVQCVEVSSSQDYTNIAMVNKTNSFNGNNLTNISFIGVGTLNPSALIDATGVSSKGVNTVISGINNVQDSSDAFGLYIQTLTGSNSNYTSTAYGQLGILGFAYIVQSNVSLAQGMQGYLQALQPVQLDKAIAVNGKFLGSYGGIVKEFMGFNVWNNANFGTTIDKTYAFFIDQLKGTQLWGIYMNDATTTIKHLLVKNTQKVGIGWNGTMERSWIWNDGTNLRLTPNVTGSGIVYIDNNLSAENIIDRSDYWDVEERGDALDSVKSYVEISSDDNLSEYEKSFYSVTDYSNCKEVIWRTEYCWENIKSINDADKLICSYEQNKVPKDAVNLVLDEQKVQECGTKTETGRSISAVIGKHEQALAEYHSAVDVVKISQNITQPALDSKTIIADNFYTKSKTIQNGVDYFSKLKNKTKLSDKKEHYAFESLTSPDGRNYSLLNMEERLVVLEGFANSIMTEMCDKQPNQWSWCDKK